MDLMGGHTNYLVPQGTADDTTNELRGPRASQGVLVRALTRQHQTVLALTAEGAVFPLVPPRDDSSRSMPGEGSFPLGRTAQERGKDGGSEIYKVGDSRKLRLKLCGRLWAHGLVDSEGRLGVHIRLEVTSRHQALLGRQSIDYLRAAVCFHVMDGLDEAKSSKRPSKS